LTPKNAFLEFNTDNSGKMTFDQFNNFIKRLSQYAREPIPGFSIIKDIFDFIDIRRDGIIDINEWMQTFKSVEVRFSHI
jgi:Ca2+-binding EF-hand superfamily protein